MQQEREGRGKRAEVGGKAAQTRNCEIIQSVTGRIIQWCGEAARSVRRGGDLTTRLRDQGGKWVYRRWTRT
ncbi:hypothetical protein J6590_011494 [Homalodisca vitripennis]|nr:hypothetical protein J6590_011494 [Homalodisca vitripennis]